MKLNLVKSVKERQDERAEKMAKIDKIKKDTIKAKSVNELRQEVERLTELIESLLS